MAARSRPRGGQLKDEFDEERSLWNQIKSDARNIDQLMVSQISFTPLAHGVSPILFIMSDEVYDNHYSSRSERNT
jgi:hypothetical protein